jgi:molecular chaperone DnaJ
MPPRDYFEKDFYSVLGVPPDATQADIAKAYRKLARELHPDARPDDPSAEARFKEVSEANAVLSNPEKRREYDQVREMASSGAFTGFPGGGFGAGQQVNLEDLLGGLFGGGGDPFGTRGAGRGRGPRRGRDVEADLTLSFSDAMAGVTTTLRVAGRATCASCRGSGARPGTAPVTCQTCGGAGTIMRDQGMFGFSEPCPACGGRGVQITDPCPACQGSGTEVRTRQVRARIPAGVRDAARIRLKGKGEAGQHGGPAGDLFVRVHVEPHPLFGRRGDHLTITVPVTFPEAALGAKLAVPTLDEPVTVKIPPGTESGKTLRVKGRGAPKPGGGRGDLLVTVQVAVPRKLSRAQRKLLEEYAQTDNGTVRGHLDAALREG